MSFTLLSSLMSLVDRGLDEYRKSDQKAYGILTEQAAGYKNICAAIDAGNRRKRDAWNEPVSEKYRRD